MIIDAGVDDARLSCSAFRVYAHLCRRATKAHVAWPGVLSISKTCGVSKGTVIAAIKELEHRGFISVKRQWGSGSKYEILPQHCWTTVPHIEPVSNLDQYTEPTEPVQNRERTIPYIEPRPVQNRESKESIELDHLRSPRKDPNEFVPPPLRRSNLIDRRDPPFRQAVHFKREDVQTAIKELLRYQEEKFGRRYSRLEFNSLMNRFEHVESAKLVCKVIDECISKGFKNPVFPDQGAFL